MTFIYLKHAFVDCGVTAYPFLFFPIWINFCLGTCYWKDYIFFPTCNICSVINQLPFAFGFISELLIVSVDLFADVDTSLHY